MRAVILFVIIGLVLGQRNIYSGNPEGVVFPGPISTTNRKIYSRHREEEQPSLSHSLSVAQQLDELDSVDDFLDMIDGVPEDEKHVLMSNRFGGVERTSALVPTPAKCMPELQPVSFMGEEKDASVIYYPPCTRIKRCGGCCSHSLLSCQPVTTETRNFVVVVSKINGDGKFRYRNKEIIPLEEHTSCKCQCKIKAEHCTEKQEYVQNECRCRCMNSDEEAKCRGNNETKLWDPEACNCLCRNVEDCNTGYYFDQNTCSCKPIGSARRFGLGPDYRYPQITRSRENPPVIVTLDANDPRRRHKDEPTDY